jgi:hypothetical protein
MHDFKRFSRHNREIEWPTEQEGYTVKRVATECLAVIMIVWVTGILIYSFLMG